jgi:hypothetical protein
MDIISGFGPVVGGSIPPRLIDHSAFVGGEQLLISEDCYWRGDEEIKSASRFLLSPFLFLL